MLEHQASLLPVAAEPDDHEGSHEADPLHLVGLLAVVPSLPLPDPQALLGGGFDSLLGLTLTRFVALVWTRQCSRFGRWCQGEAASFPPSRRSQSLLSTGASVVSLRVRGRRSRATKPRSCPERTGPCRSP